MILKTAANYNDEGGYIEAWENSDGTTEVKLIPKIGGDEGKNGIRSVTISPAITTTPVLDSMFPIYWEDLTDEKKEMEKYITAAVSEMLVPTDEYTITITPTDDMYAIYSTEDNTVIGETAGAPINVTVKASELTKFEANATDDTDLQSATKIVIAIVELEIQFRDVQ